jgi:hypothetical protein
MGVLRAEAPQPPCRPRPPACHGLLANSRAGSWRQARVDDLPVLLAPSSERIWIGRSRTVAGTASITTRKVHGVETAITALRRANTSWPHRVAGLRIAPGRDTTDS